MNNKRKDAMVWWHGLSSLQKTQICDTNTELVGSVRRWETLTGREIEMLYEEGDDTTLDVETPNKNRGTQRSPFGIGS